MALFFTPPPPPPAPTLYEPPTPDEVDQFEEEVLAPFSSFLENWLGRLRGISGDLSPSMTHYATSALLEEFGRERYKAIWPLFYPTTIFETNLLRQVHTIRSDLANLPRTPPTEPTPPTQVFDVAPVMAAIDKGLQDLKKETALSC